MKAGNLWVSNSVLPTRDSFEMISNDIPSVNISPLFLLTIHSKL